MLLAMSSLNPFIKKKNALMTLPLIKSMPKEYEFVKECIRSSSETSNIPG